MKKPDKKAVDAFLSRGIAEIVGVSPADLSRILLSGKKLKVKHGVDPTTPDLHLGYSVVYHKLRALQDMGHTVQFLIGGFTARFGDPTEQEHSRKLRSKADIRKLSSSYLKQACKILDPKKTEVRYNSEWYDKMSAEELLKLMSHFTYAQMIERDMFQKRMKANQKIGFHEPVYPLLQGYDSVMLKDDLTVIGTDQIFNEMRGRDLQRDFGQNPQIIIATPLLTGTDGVQKMSQSLGNHIGITEDAKTQYGKIMSIPDNIIADYFELATDISAKELNGIKNKLADRAYNPRDLKMRLAQTIVKTYHGAKAADKAQSDFIAVFQKHSLPSDIKTIATTAGYDWKSPLPKIMTITGVSGTNSDARRLIAQGSVRLDGTQVTSINTTLDPKKNEQILQVGKRRIVKLKKRK